MEKQEGSRSGACKGEAEQSSGETLSIDFIKYWIIQTKYIHIAMIFFYSICDIINIHKSDFVIFMIMVLWEVSPKILENCNKIVRFIA